MPESRHPEDGDALLARVAARAADQPHLFAYMLARYAALHRLDEKALCALLACDVPTLNRLRLCGRPDPDAASFGYDVRRIAGALGLDAGLLAGIVREVEATEAFQKASDAVAAYPFSATPDMLQAARDREEGPGAVQETPTDYSPGGDTAEGTPKESDDSGPEDEPGRE